MVYYPPRQGSNPSGDSFRRLTRYNFPSVPPRAHRSHISTNWRCPPHVPDPQIKEDVAKDLSLFSVTDIEKTKQAPPVSQYRDNPQAWGSRGQDKSKDANIEKAVPINEASAQSQVVHHEPFYIQTPVLWPAPLKALQLAMKKSSGGAEVAKWDYHKLLLASTKLVYLDLRGRDTRMEATVFELFNINPAVHDALYLMAEKMCVFFASEHRERTEILNKWPFCYPTLSEKTGHEKARDFVENQLTRAKSFSCAHFDNGTPKLKLTLEKTQVNEDQSEEIVDDGGEWSVVKPTKAFNHKKAKKGKKH